MSKHSRGSASKGKPIPKKARRESEAEALMPKVVPSGVEAQGEDCLLYTSPSPRDRQKSRMPSSA